MKLRFYFNLQGNKKPKPWAPVEYTKSRINFGGAVLHDVPVVLADLNSRYHDTFSNCPFLLSKLQ